MHVFSRSSNDKCAITYRNDPNFWDRQDWSGQTVQTQIRLLLEEQSDLGLHCCYSTCIILTKYSKDLACLFELLLIISDNKIYAVKNITNFATIVEPD